MPADKANEGVAACSPATALDEETFKLLLLQTKHCDNHKAETTTKPTTTSNELESIQEFRHWKDDFLATFRQYLDPVGTATAREADESLHSELEGLVSALAITAALAGEGRITPETTSVKGQRSITETITNLKSCETSIEEYVPKTRGLERKRGYTKFELAAILVRDGFRVYGLMVQTKDVLTALVTEGGSLSEVLEPNQLTVVMYYFRALEAFQETMADLGMYRVMKDCVELYKIRPRSKKKKKFRKNGTKDALDDTSCDEDCNDDDETEKKKRKPKKKAGKPKKKKHTDATTSSSSTAAATDKDDGLINNGRMFENKHGDNSNNSDGTHKKKNIRTIMDNGWSNGLSPGDETRDPNRATSSSKPKRKNKNKNKTTSRKNKNRSDDGESDGGGGGGGNNDDDDDDDSSSKPPKKNRTKTERSSKNQPSPANNNGNAESGCGDDDTGAALVVLSGDGCPRDRSSGANDDDETNATTLHTTDDDETPDDDESSSSSSVDDDEDDDDDFVYYFDPVQKVVGKLSRSECIARHLIVTAVDRSGKETFDGLVDEWDSRRETKAGGESGESATNAEHRPGKTELISTLKEILRAQ